jgi:sugar O-acyltransferase (sialic acid O-acetyltransferase NeuD family)
MSESARVVVVGAGGHGSEVGSYMDHLVRAGWTGEFLGFLDDTQPPIQSAGMKILGTVADYASRSDLDAEDVRYLTAVGRNEDRCKLVRRIDSLFVGRLRPWTLIHPAATVGPCEIGEGTLLAPGTIVGSRARIGRHCILNVKASVLHDCQVGDFVNLNPGSTICGWCRIGDGAFVGAGATVIDRVSIGEGAIIGAGAVVVRDIPPHVTAVGVPARVIRTHATG